MSIMLGRRLGLKLLEALQVDSSNVRKLTVVCDAEDAATITVERFVTSQDAETLADVLRLATEQYTIQPKGEGT